MPARKTPSNVKQLRGTKQPCREKAGVELEFDSLEQAPEAPSYLEVGAKNYWEKIVPLLIEKRVLAVADLEALEVLCVLYGAVRKMAAAGVDISASTVTQLRLYQAEFGLTPASRPKVSAGDPSKKGNKFSGRGRKPG